MDREEERTPTQEDVDCRHSAVHLHEADVGFDIIVDRRQDKWGSVKTLLLRISGCFPALVQKVYILRPSSFLQKAFADVGLKFLVEDFKAKILMVNTLDELHSYIGRDQLTTDLGGTLQYDHREWIQHRAALEKFSGSASEIAGRLRQLCSRLQDTQFPNDVHQTESLIAEHNVARLEVRQDLESVVRHGEALLVCFKTVRTDNSTDDDDDDGCVDAVNNCTDVQQFYSKFLPTHQLPVCRIAHVTAVERLLIQLDETSGNFETFWLSHKRRLEQCLQLRNFEEQFRQLQISAEQHLTMLNGFESKSCESTEQVEALADQLHDFEASSKEDILRAQELQVCGENFIDASHYAIDCIRPKCAELERITAEYRLILEKQYQRLDTLRQLCSTIDETSNWCMRGEGILRSLEEGNTGQVELQSQLTELQLLLDEVNSIKLNSLDSFFDTSLDNSVGSGLAAELHATKLQFETVRRECEELCSSLGSRVLSTTTDKQHHVMKELIDTEHVYVEELNSIIKGYMMQVDNPEIENLVTDTLKSSKHIIFGNLDEIYSFHANLFLKELNECRNTPSSLGRCFVKRSVEFQLYETYCQNMAASEQLLKQQDGINTFFQECQKKLGHRLPLGAYLLKPVQRITKYQLLLKEMLKHCEADGSCEDLELALATMLSIVKHVNDVMHQVSIRGFQDDFSTLGRLLMQGSFNVWLEHRRDRIRDLRFKPMSRHVFLYERAVLFCKRKDDPDNGANAVYLYKNHISTADIGVTESVKGDRRKFEVWLRGRTEVYILQAASVEVKEVWLVEFKRVLQNQFDELREHRRKRNIGHYAHSQDEQMQTASGSSAGCLRIETDSDVCLRRSETDSVMHIATGLPAWELCRSPTVDAYMSSFDCNTAAKTWSESTFYTVSRTHIATSSSELTVYEGQLLQLVSTGQDGQWYVRSTTSEEEGWVAAQCLQYAKQSVSHSLDSMNSSAEKSGEEESTV